MCVAAAFKQALLCSCTMYLPIWIQILLGQEGAHKPCVVLQRERLVTAHPLVFDALWVANSALTPVAC
jgi:hypothetical protein